jgi:hypothetical protein
LEVDPAGRGAGGERHERGRVGRVGDRSGEQLAEQIRLDCDQRLGRCVLTRRRHRALGLGQHAQRYEVTQRGGQRTAVGDRVHNLDPGLDRGRANVGDQPGQQHLPAGAGERGHGQRQVGVTARGQLGYATGRVLTGAGLVQPRELPFHHKAIAQQRGEHLAEHHTMPVYQRKQLAVRSAEPQQRPA